MNTLLGLLAAAIGGLLRLLGVAGSGKTEGPIPPAPDQVPDSTREYWEGVAADPVDYEDSVENLETVEDEELLG